MFLNNLVAKYLLKSDNFKKVYNLMVKNSIPNSIATTRFEANNGFETTVGFKIFDNKDNTEQFVREINVLNKQTV